MVNLLLQWETLSKIIINTLSNSIWEEAFIIMFALTFMGNYSFLELDQPQERRFKKREIIDLAIPVLISALTSNIMRYTGVDYTVSTIIFMLVLLLSVIIVHEMWKDVREISKTLLFLFIGALITMILEFVYIPLVLYATGITVVQLNNNLLWNFLITLPARACEAVIISYLLSKKALPLKANLIKPIVSSRFLTILTLGTVLFDTVYMCFMVKIIGYDKALIAYSLTTQLFAIIGTLLFPIINIFALLWGIYYKADKIKSKQSETIEDIDDDINGLIRDCTEKGDYDTLIENLAALKGKVNALKEI